MDPDLGLSPDYLAQNRGPVLIRVVIAFVVLETAFLCVYLASRWISHTLRGWDVYLMLLAYVMQLGNGAAAVGESRIPLRNRATCLWRPHLPIVPSSTRRCWRRRQTHRSSGACRDSKGLENSVRHRVHIRLCDHVPETVNPLFLPEDLFDSSLSIRHLCCHDLGGPDMCGRIYYQPHNLSADLFPVESAQSSWSLWEYIGGLPLYQHSKFGDGFPYASASDCWSLAPATKDDQQDWSHICVRGRMLVSSGVIIPCNTMTDRLFLQGVRDRYSAACLLSQDRSLQGSLL